MKQKISKNELLPLIGLTLSAFIFNTSEFIPIGLLTDIANAFSMNEAQAGVMMTVYSWTVTLLSLPLMLLVCKLNYKRLLLGVMGLFGLCQLASAMAPTFHILVLSRFGVACVHSIFWSIVSPLALRVVSKEHRELALSMVVTGTSIAMILGMPLGRIIGLTFGWRSPFGLIAIIALMVFLYLWRVFPNTQGSSSFTMKQLPALLKDPVPVGIYIFLAIFVTGYYTGYSYIEPFLKQVAHLSDASTTMTLTIFGLTGLLGSFLFSKLYSKIRFGFLILSTSTMAAMLYLLYPSTLIHPSLIVLVCAIWGIAATAFNVAFQFEMMQSISQDVSAIAMAIYSAIFNFGIGCGTYTGGFVETKLNLSYISLFGGAFVTIAIVFCIVWLIPKLKQAK